MEVAVEPVSPAQRRMAEKRDELARKKAAVDADLAKGLSDDVVSLARAQKEKREAAERARALAEAKTKGIPTKEQRAEEARAMLAKGPKERVTVRVTKFGADKISTGVHVPAIGDVMYEAGATFEHDRELAQALEAQGLVEIED